MDDLVLRLQFDNNYKLIINVSQEDTTSSLIEKIKSFYALHYSKRIQLGSLKDDKGFEIINDIKISSLFRNGDVLCVFVKEVGDYKSCNSNGLINYDYKENKCSRKEKSRNAIIKDYSSKEAIKDLIPNPPKNTTLTTLPKTKLPLKEEERSLTMNPITENNKDEKKEEDKKEEEKKEEKEIKKPRKRRTVKPKEDDKKIKKEEGKIKNEVEDPFSVFEDLKKKTLNNTKSLNDKTPL
ncbi:hypothetical protein NBO_149g0001 [Nosema bombycis CQ1]|uniref:Uncharacterized protein n=1 Tax=Nosema bombycis (strain CQ1 / CVCC 102059) TaxID=578461 RepID=R0MK50_NOSB1|nr:hypothetical protein NBO_149g0001 [Nosema bombycis CQ1]|eukprot:EOB13168.1 hypothetical protein NBO_149g0001 [Nosema bombycis CQ1]